MDRPGQVLARPPLTLLEDAHAAGLKVGAYTFRAENQYLPAAYRKGTAPDDFGDAFAEYAFHFGRGVDAVVTDFPDLAALARDGLRSWDERLITSGPSPC